MNGKTITFKTNGHTCEGYFSIPDTGGGPGIIVLQEWWGLVGHIKDLADRFAIAGFAALAPDIYHGDSTTHPDDAGRLMMALNIDQTQKDLNGAVNFLLDHVAVSSDAIGTVGFCMGGQLSLFAACANPSIGACVDFYGIHPNVQLDMKNLRAPVLGIFAENDEFVTMETAKGLESKLKEHGKETDFTYYPEVGHAFFNDSREDVYNEEAASDAWQKVITFFDSNL
tara:strand:- start:47020 stop:47697 length:678 start_codon:yes stop_codon:yes gene_type:complete